MPRRRRHGNVSRRFSVAMVATISLLSALWGTNTILLARAIRAAPAARTRSKTPRLSTKTTAPTKGSAVASKHHGVANKATVPQEVFNLVKCIVGAGVLSLPAGIARMARETSTNATTLVATACLLIAVVGGASAYTFSMIARVCRSTNSQTYAECWTKTRGASTAWTVALSSTLDCLAGTLTYSMVLADAFHQLLSALLETNWLPAPIAGAIRPHNTRSRVLLVLTVGVLLPLCCVENLSALAPFSAVGIAGMLYTGLAIGIRYFDGSYAVPHGRYVTDAMAQAVPEAAAGKSNAVALLTNPNSLILISMLSTAYIAHFNAPRFYRELQGVEEDPRRFHFGVVGTSFGTSVLFYALVSSLGYLTFGGHTNAEGMLLTNYSTRDALVGLSRLAVGISLVFSYPLLFVGLRDGLLDLTGQWFGNRTRQPPSRTASNLLTCGLLACITGLALRTTDLTLVASLSGALLGTSLIFIFPPLMLRSVLDREGAEGLTPGQRIEKQACWLLVGWGVFVAGVGAKLAWTTAGTSAS